MSKAYDAFMRLLKSTTYTTAQSYYDSFVETNCMMKASAGINQMIIRRQLGRCCDWCARLAGSYEIADAPKDIYKRHRNCRCLVTSKNASGYTDVWSKKQFTLQRKAREKREEELLENFKKQKEAKVTAKNIDNLLSRKYYNSPAKIKNLQEVFNRDTSEGWFNASIGFESYLSDYVRIEEELVGLKTLDGIEVKCQAEHFLTRVYGTIKDPIKGNRRQGVGIDDVKSTLLNGKIIQKKENSVTYKWRRFMVTLNPGEGRLVQCNHT